MTQHDVHALAAEISAPQQPGPQPVTGYLVQTIAGPMMLPVEALPPDFLARQRAERNIHTVRGALAERIFAHNKTGRDHIDSAGRLHEPLDANDRRTALILALDAALTKLAPKATVPDIRAYIMTLQRALAERRVVGAHVIRRHDHNPGRDVGNCFGLLALMTGAATSYVDDHSTYGALGEDPPAYRAAYLRWMKDNAPFTQVLACVEMRLPFFDDGREQTRGAAEVAMLREALAHWLELYTEGAPSDPANYISPKALLAHPDDRIVCAGCGGTYAEEEVSDCHECEKVYCHRLGCWTQHVTAQHPNYGEE